MISESEALGIENELASADAAVRRNALSELKELLDIKKLMPAEPGRDCFLNCRLAPDSGAPAAHSPSHLAYLARKNGWAVTGLLDEAKGAEEFIEAAVYLNIRAAIGLSGCLAGVEGTGPMVSYSWRKSGRIEQQALGIPVKRLRLCLQLLQEKLSIKEFNDFFRLCGALPAAVGLTCCPDRVWLDWHRDNGTALLHLMPEEVDWCDLELLLQEAARRGLPVVLDLPPGKRTEAAEQLSETSRKRCFEGALLVAGHSLLATVEKGYAGDWAQHELPELAERNRFYSDFGRRVLPNDFIALKFSPVMSPQEIFAQL
ncbi:hypothetical protein [Victivallis sp. Marseille-Q1083]|uniref:hypothetical protein n=1 Tax=Victivallis sp. Marseille-Q1083 TaxID=2717288 RepID=UPI00158E714E|nr:hypothetical protein [Victivallis sp. Marseille-Q1083]